MEILETETFRQAKKRLLSKREYQFIQRQILSPTRLIPAIRQSGGIRKLVWVGTIKGRRRKMQILYYYRQISCTQTSRVAGSIGLGQKSENAGHKIVDPSARSGWADMLGEFGRSGRSESTGEKGRIWWRNRRPEQVQRERMGIENSGGQSGRGGHGGQDAHGDQGVMQEQITLLHVCQLRGSQGLSLEQVRRLRSAVRDELGKSR